MFVTNALSSIYRFTFRPVSSCPQLTPVKFLSILSELGIRAQSWSTGNGSEIVVHLFNRRIKFLGNLVTCELAMRFCPSGPVYHLLGQPHQQEHWLYHTNIVRKWRSLSGIIRRIVLVIVAILLIACLGYNVATSNLILHQVQYEWTIHHLSIVSQAMIHTFPNGRH